MRHDYVPKAVFVSLWMFTCNKNTYACIHTALYIYIYFMYIKRILVHLWPPMKTNWGNKNKLKNLKDRTGVNDRELRHRIHPLLGYLKLMPPTVAQQKSRKKNSDAMAEKSQKVIFLQKIKNNNQIPSLLLCFLHQVFGEFISDMVHRQSKKSPPSMCLKLMQRSWGLTSDIPHKDIAILASKI